MEEQMPGRETTTSGNSKGNQKVLLYACLGVLFVVGLIIGGKWLIHRMTYTTTDDAQVDADMLQVSSKVPGRILRLSVKEGDAVRAGQLVAEIDPAEYELALSQAEARLESQRRELEKAKMNLSFTVAQTNIGVLQSSSSLDQVEGNVSISSTQHDVNMIKLRKDLERAQESYAEAKALAEQSERDLVRADELFKKGVVSKQQLDLARTGSETAQARLAGAEKTVETALSAMRTSSIDSSKVAIAEQDRNKANLALTLSKKQRVEQGNIAKATVESLKEQVRAMEDAVGQARLALKETRVLSPVDGVVAKTASLSGQIVPSGQPIFFILNTGTLHVSANIEETFIHNLHVGSKAKVTVDALPGETFKGVVTVIGAAANSKFALIPSGNSSGQFIKTTQRVPVKIQLSGDLSKLKPATNVIVDIKNNQ